MLIHKPDFWDKKNPNIILKVLKFFFYFIIIFMTKSPKQKIKVKNIKTICIGNIYLGGTGKTPTSITIFNVLKKQGYRTTFIKKFYRDQIDEQRLLKKNGNLICLKSRVEAIKHAKLKKYNFAICDDGLQDRYLNYDLKIVCFNFDTFIGNGLTIPAGPLREKIENIKNFDAAIINGNGENINKQKKFLEKFNKKIKIFQGTYIVKNKNLSLKNNKYIAFSGIGNHKTFLKTLKKNQVNILKSYKFPDHYKYKNKDIIKIKAEAVRSNCKIITTEKDILRLSKENKRNIKFLEVSIKINNKKKFVNYLKSI